MKNNLNHEVVLMSNILSKVYLIQVFVRFNSFLRLSTLELCVITGHLILNLLLFISLMDHPFTYYLMN